MRKKVNRECYNHKQQPIPDTKRKRKWTELTREKQPNKCMKSTNTTLPFHRRDGENMDRVKRIWYLSPLRAAKVQASLRIRAVSPEPSRLAHTSSESRGTFSQKARSLAPLNGWACAVKICHDGMLEDTNSLDGADIFIEKVLMNILQTYLICDIY